MRLTKNFELREWVDPQTWNIYGNKSVIFLDMRIVYGIQAIRDYYNRPVIVNNWHRGGRYRNRGFRPRNSTVGKKTSQHRYGRGCDFNVLGVPAKKVWTDILNLGDMFLAAGITTIEDVKYTPHHTHTDCRYTGLSRILIVGN